MKKRAGITLLELLLSLALFSLIFLSITNIFMLGTKTHAKSLGEFNVQSNVRIISQSVNGVIRDSLGIFLLNKEYPENPADMETYLTEGWNYLMLNKDKTKLVEWVWDEAAKKHNERIIIDSFSGVTYDLVYNKTGTAKENRLLGYTLDVNVNGQKRTITSELEGVNTLQVIDRSYGAIANTISYRGDPRLTDIAIAQAAVSFVIDRSGSMDYSLSSKKRIVVLKEEAAKMINGLAEYENIWMSISPFNDSANNSSGDDLNRMMNLKLNKDKFIGSGSIINNLTPNGNTNTGDGMRRGFYSIVNYNNENEDKTIRNFMIILVDGETNRGTITEVINNEYTEWLSSKKDFVMINDRKYVYSSSGIFDIYHTYRWSGENKTTYLEKDGNVESTSGISENTLYVNGRIYSNTNEGHNYVDRMGEEIKKWRNTRGDGIEVFVIGFSPDATPSGLQRIAIATESTHGTESVNSGGKVYKYYKANTAEALDTVLNDIKFQISDALWHIGGPN